MPVVAAASRDPRFATGRKPHIPFGWTSSPDLEAPIRSGDVVGTARIQLKGKDVPGVPPVPLKAGKDVERAGWWTLFFRSVTEWFR